MGRRSPSSSAQVSARVAADTPLGLDADGVVGEVERATILHSTDTGQVCVAEVSAVAVSGDGEGVVTVVTGTVGSSGTSVGSNVDVSHDSVTELLLISDSVGAVSLGVSAGHGLVGGRTVSGLGGLPRSVHPIRSPWSHPASETLSVGQLSGDGSRSSGPLGPDITSFDTIGGDSDFRPVWDLGLGHNGGGGNERESGEENGFGEGDHYACCVEVKSVWYLGLGGCC